MPRWSIKGKDDERLLTEKEKERFWRKVVVDCACDCWVWVGAKADGYGRVRFRKKVQGAHRVAYSTWRGRIPERMDLDHFVCQRTDCVNPWHLEPATHRVNILRGTAPPAINAAKAECVNGHPLNDPKNVWVRDDGSRNCRACMSARRRAIAPDGRTNQSIYTARWRAKRAAAATP